MPLTDVAVRAARPSDKTLRLFDGGGLYLEVATSGSRYWRWKYRYAEREKRLALGVYPEVGLKLARERRDEARRLLAAGVDPSAARKAQRASRAAAAGNTFEVLAREWFETNKATWVPEHADKIWHRIEKNLLPWLGLRPMSEITPPELLGVLRKAESRGKRETARRSRQIAGKIFRYAVASGRAERDPSQDLRGALAAPVARHLAAITDPKQVGPLLLAIDGYVGTPVVSAALRLAPLVFVRPGELRQARWAEFDLDVAQWSIPAERMKMRQPHIVPLSTQAVAVLRDLKPHTGNFEFVFPSARSPCRSMSNNAVNAALRCMGIDHETMCGHGFRAMARTILDEVLKYRVDVIEQQLAHAVRDPNGRAYNRTTHLEARKEMMQGWADYLDRLRANPESTLRAA
ncbi:MAG: tyrosine-type recombinase/integrase [Steroidobacteraceae bacterium]